MADPISPISIPAQDWILKQGDTQNWSFQNKKQVTPGDNTNLINRFDFTDGGVARMQLRKTPSDKVVLTLASNGSAPDHLILGASDCSVNVRISAATMSKIAAGDYFYDVEYDTTGTDGASGNVATFAEGTITITAEITKPV